MVNDAVSFESGSERYVASWYWPEGAAARIRVLGAALHAPARARGVEPVYSRSTESRARHSSPIPSSRRAFAACRRAVPHGRSASPRASCLARLATKRARCLHSADTVTC